MLSKYGLYPKIGGGQLPKSGLYTELDIILWLLFWCDGKDSMTEIAKTLSIEEELLENIAQKLVQKGVLRFG